MTPKDPILDNSFTRVIEIVLSPIRPIPVARQVLYSVLVFVLTMHEIYAAQR